MKPSLTREQKIQALAQITWEIADCSICRQQKIGKPVPGEGDPEAKIVFLGEAPGKQEAATGQPFIGRSGKLLRQQIESIGLKENEIYITSPVKYLPEHGTPTPQEIIHGVTHLQKQLNLINPNLIALLGATACKALLSQPIQLSKSHGQLIQENHQNYFITYHPAAPLRFAPLRQTFHEDFQKLKLMLDTLLSSNT